LAHDLFCLSTTWRPEFDTVIEIRKYRRADGVVPFDRWMATLRDVRAKARILVQLDRLRLGLPGDWKAIGAGGVRAAYPLRQRIPGVLRTRGHDDATSEHHLREARRLFTAMGAAGHAERVARMMVESPR